MELSTFKTPPRKQDSNVEITPRRKFHIIVYCWIRRVGICIGQNILDDKFKIRGYSLVIMALVALNIISGIWTVLFYNGQIVLDAGSFNLMMLRVILRNLS